MSTVAETYAIELHRIPMEDRLPTDFGRQFARHFDLAPDRTLRLHFDPCCVGAGHRKPIGPARENHR